METDPELSRATAEPFGWWAEWNGDDSDIGNYIFTMDKDELDTEHVWLPLFAEHELRAEVDRLRKGCQELHAALGRCAYLAGQPNEMEVTWYDVEPEPSLAVKLVEDEFKRLRKLAREDSQTVDKKHLRAIRFLIDLAVLCLVGFTAPLWLIPVVAIYGFWNFYDGYAHGDRKWTKKTSG